MLDLDTRVALVEVQCVVGIRGGCDERPNEIWELRRWGGQDLVVVCPVQSRREALGVGSMPPNVETRYSTDHAPEFVIVPRSLDVGKSGGAAFHAIHDLLGGRYA